MRAEEMARGGGHDGSLSAWVGEGWRQDGEAGDVVDLEQGL